MIQLKAIEAADTELEWQESGREKVLEQNFQSILRVHLDDVEKYGLEHCLYFQALRIFGKVYFFISLLAIVQILFALEGTRFAGRSDLCSVLATLTLGNVDESTGLSVGMLRFRLSAGLDSSTSIGVCLVLQLFFPALALVLLMSYFWRRLAGHPDLASEPSVADYALEVFGLPNSCTESEILSHFESLLKDCPEFEPSSGLVCDVAIARDFRGALLCAMEQASERLEKHQLEEQQRPVWSAFLVLSNELERDWLMQRYRFFGLPVLRHLQWRSHSYCGKWPLYLRAAPEPCDIVWTHYLDGRCCSRVSMAHQLLLRGSTVLLLGLSLAAGSTVSWLIWWQSLGIQGTMAAMQCSIWSPSTSSCGCSTSSECLTWPAPLAVVANWCLAELIRLGGAWLMHWHSSWWRCTSRASHESGRMILEVLAQSGSAFCPVFGLWLLKLSWAYGIVPLPLGEMGIESMWQGDLSVFLYAIPVIELWCLSRWLLVIFHAFRSCLCGKKSQRFILWRQYASLVSVLGTTLVFQPVAPVLAPLTAFGLVCRYWLEKLLMVNGAMTVRCGTPVRLALQLANTAGTCLWIAILGACGLTFYILWEGTWSTWSMSSPAAFFVILALMMVGFPLLEWLYRQIFWFACGVGSPPGTWRPAVRSLRKDETARWWNQVTPPRMSYHEAWLIMRHKRILSSYSFFDHPDFHRSNLQQRLQPHGSLGSGAATTAMLPRSIDVTCSRAVVLEKAPTRSEAK